MNPTKEHKCEQQHLLKTVLWIFKPMRYFIRSLRIIGGVQLLMFSVSVVLIAFFLLVASVSLETMTCRALKTHAPNILQEGQVPLVGCTKLLKMRKKEFHPLNLSADPALPSCHHLRLLLIHPDLLSRHLPAASVLVL